MKRVRIHKVTNAAYGGAAMLTKTDTRISEEWLDRYTIAYDKLKEEGVYPIYTTLVKEKAKEMGYETPDTITNIGVWLRKEDRELVSKKEYQAAQAKQKREALAAEIKSLMEIGFRTPEDLYPQLTHHFDSMWRFKMEVGRLKKAGLL